MSLFRPCSRPTLYDNTVGERVPRRCQHGQVLFTCAAYGGGIRKRREGCTGMRLYQGVDTGFRPLIVGRWGERCHDAPVNLLCIHVTHCFRGPLCAFGAYFRYLTLLEGVTHRWSSPRTVAPSFFRALAFSLSLSFSRSNHGDASIRWSAC